MMWQTGQIQIALTGITARMACNLLAWLLGIERSGRFGLLGGSQIKEVPLPFPPENPLAAPAMNPPLVPGKLFERRGMLLLQFLERSRGRVEDPVEFGDPLLRFRNTSNGIRQLLLQVNSLLVRHQQQAVAFRQIVGQKVGVIHGSVVVTTGPEGASPNWPEISRKCQRIQPTRRYLLRRRPLLRSIPSSKWASWDESNSMPCW